MTISDLVFDNSFTRSLPADRELDNFPRQVMEASYSRVQPKKCGSPSLVAYSREVLEDLGLNEEMFNSQEFTEQFVNTFSGNDLLEDMDPYANCYGGHQFGHWAGQLGDGRAITLGEVLVNDRRHTLQLKGAGMTPYSRSADGLAVLRSSVREFLCSEAMYHLGVPTTRALSLVLTGDKVLRDMFYDGHPEMETGAIVCRVAQSFTRFGNFEIFASRGDLDNLKKLLDYTIRTDFPHLGEPCEDVYLKWFNEVCLQTSEMIVHWMRVGFVHGVMNTDNMSVLGLTIDYGPYGWLEDYDETWTPNTTDAEGKRYRFGQQAQIAQWNLIQLANAIHPLVENSEALERSLNNYADIYIMSWQQMMAHKLGLKNFKGEEDEKLIVTMLELLSSVETDMTIFYRALADIKISVEGEKYLKAEVGEAFLEPLADAYYLPTQLNETYLAKRKEWIEAYVKRVMADDRSDDERKAAMNKVNPKYVLRNYLAQLAIDEAEKGDFTMTHELLDVLRKPYDEQEGKEIYSEKRPDWARTRAGCSMLSCSS